MKSDNEIDPNGASATPKKPGMFGRLRGALRKTSQNLVSGISGLFAGRTTVDEDTLEDLEAVLLAGDVGVAATGDLLAGLRERVKKEPVNDADDISRVLVTLMAEILAPVAQPLQFSINTGQSPGQPFILLAVGMNGAGKTTTLGKIARQLKSEGKSVLFAAGDTFRAAAVEQIRVWGERNDVPVVAQQAGADSASVIFDACQAARARNIDVVLADTAGRLHTQDGLMAELEKIVRVIKKFDPDAPHETLLVLDGGVGQNALVQAREFSRAVSVSGVAITKLDGTARGGIMLAIARELGLPVRYIGVGEGIDDLRPFEPDAFAQALLERAN